MMENQKLINELEDIKFNTTNRMENSLSEIANSYPIISSISPIINNKYDDNKYLDMSVDFKSNNRGIILVFIIK